MLILYIVHAVTILNVVIAVIGVVGVAYIDITTNYHGIRVMKRAYLSKKVREKDAGITAPREIF